MLPQDFFLRIPSSTALLVISHLIASATSIALPQQTKTIEFRELNVRPWPLDSAPAPTAAVELNDLFRRQQLNTVCGYIGGDPDLPATCSAGSHCAVDVENGAVGCCPDGGSCTTGVYTGCVDGNSPPQNELNPYVYTCKGGDMCYQNKFEGGFSQYGCGSTTGMDATVSLSASGKDAIDMTSLSLQLTEPVSTLSEPTTLGTKTSESSQSSETDSTATSETTTSDKTSSTSEPTETNDDDDDNDEELAAPKNDDNKPNTGLIVGATIGGIAGLALIALALSWAIRRKRGNSRQGPGQNTDTKYISSPVADHFAPLPSIREVDEAQMPRQVPLAHSGSISDDSREGHLDPNRPAEYQTVSPASAIAAPSALGGSGPLDSDRAPLTEYNNAMYGIHEEDDGQQQQYQRSGGSGGFWHQNRQQSRNLMWM
ncbi:hypothetical protein N3K66_000397 [Trichothecium roseum]|uniref:Uncharacterized protein n=1 Tax=Trichothecium roseum TaxID=47278 RepID=A0ACC0VCL2_9HYPO|nr:hypothetical protein N3K66_000397 [Trichothecium roseum]